MTRRRSRDLSPEERALWEEVSRLIVPLAGRRTPTPPAPTLPIPQPAPPPKVHARERTLPRPRPSPSVAPSAPPPAPPVPAPPALERRERLALRRGAAGVDAVLDLHGMRQAEAHAALAGFLLRAGREGHRMVLVVTGKGGGMGGGEGGDDTVPPWAERGVLRRSVPRWLALPELRRLVVGFEEAGPRHGGGGALYVRLRRRVL